ncbi:MAG: hypothetical protein IPK16_17185 [Anaerolineales bacterium]|nr:hypothetical protein [Anaerolineales bacterium]
MSYDLEQRRRREQLEEMRRAEQNDNLLACGVIAVLAAVAGAAFMLALVAMGMLAFFLTGPTVASVAAAPTPPVASPTAIIALPALESGATVTASLNRRRGCNSVGDDRAGQFRTRTDAAAGHRMAAGCTGDPLADLSAGAPATCLGCGARSNCTSHAANHALCRSHGGNCGCTGDGG